MIFTRSSHDFVYFIPLGMIADPSSTFKKNSSSMRIEQMPDSSDPYFL